MSPHLYIAMFAVQRLGAAAVFLDSWARAGQVGQCVALVEPKAMIAPEKAYDYALSLPEVALPECRVVVGAHRGSYRASLEDLASGAGSMPICPVEQDQTALITFTTGSSGVPKGADRTHRFLAAQHHAIDSRLPYRPDDLDLPVFPIFSLNNMAGGVSTVLPAIDLARPNPQDGATLAAQIRDTGVTCCTLSPSLLRGVAAHAARTGEVLPTLRRVVTGGAPISSEDVAAVRSAAPRADVVILYGSTEVEPIAHLDAADMPDERGHEGVCVGRLCAGLRAAFLRVHRGNITVDSNGLSEWEVPRGEVGELAVAGEHVCRGYYRNPGAVAATKIIEPDGTLWHRTGDLCKLDEENRIWIVGRVHNAIQRGGRLLFPVKAEIVMKQLPFVANAAYVGLPDAALGERAVAVYTLREDHAGAADAAAVCAALEQAGVVVDEIRRVDAIPLDPRHNSKVEYGVLRARLMEDHETDATTV
jgi:acyl-CoA synthetase (AMP-forming)/AMP-acid ligase II